MEIFTLNALGGVFRRDGSNALRLLLGLEALLLIGFFVLAVTLGPFPDSEAPAALLVGFTGIAAMAIQNSVQRVNFASIPPTQRRHFIQSLKWLKRRFCKIPYKIPC
jgi:hypothetical protein